ncbi:MAG TPA: hypothetical protein VES73_03320 [Lamprocystis sp. (in: g-proteobacteria)]|nr:hypothetical protein [Lamprocystis sp. (in: g-proteobacteria)]
MREPSGDTQGGKDVLPRQVLIIGQNVLDGHAPASHLSLSLS